MAGGVLYRVFNNVLLEVGEREARALLNDLAVHNARFTHYFGERTGIYAAKTDDAVFL